MVFKEMEEGEGKGRGREGRFLDVPLVWADEYWWKGGSAANMKGLPTLRTSQWEDSK